MQQFCQQCGQQLKPDAAFCGSCGTRVNAAPPPPVTPLASAPPPPPPVNITSAPSPSQPPAYVQAAPRGSGWKIVLWVALGAFGVLLFIFVAAVIYNVGRASVPITYTPSPGEPSSEVTPATEPVPATPSVDVGAIQGVLSKNNDLLTIMQKSIDGVDVQTTGDIDHIATLMNDYVSNAHQIDTQSCPRDFASAYVDYLGAWTQAADTVSAHPYIPTGDDATVYGFLRGLNGDPTGGVVDLQDEAQAWFKQVQARRAAIDDAKSRLDKIATGYGAE